MAVMQSSPALSSCQSDAQQFAQQAGSPAQAAAALRSAAQDLAYGRHPIGRPSARAKFAAQLRQLLQTKAPQARPLLTCTAPLRHMDCIRGQLLTAAMLGAQRCWPSLAGARDNMSLGFSLR